MDKQYILDFMQECLWIPSVTGDTGRCMEWIEEQFEKLGVETHRTNKGAVYGTIRGEDDDHQVLVNAHVDTLGAMVREILPNGRLRVTNVGGWTYITYEGENLLVHTMDGRTVSGTLLYEKPSVHISPVDAREEVRTEFNMEVRLDEDVHSAADTRALGIEVGDFISFDPKTVLMPNGFIKSRYIDDKACVAILFGVMKQLKEQGLRPLHTTHFYIANFEELGHGVSYIPPKVTEQLSIDIGTVGVTHNADEHSVSICAKDSRTTYDFAFRKKLVKLAQKNQIPYKVDVHYRYGSDASMSVLRGVDTNFACIGPGTDATHHYERTHTDAVMATAQLLLAYLLQEEC